MSTPASGTITGVPLGGQGTFAITFNGALQAGSVPSWAASDPSVTLTPSADGLSVVAAVPAGDTGTLFTLTNTADSSSPSVGTITTSVTVPILPAVPVPATQGVITQTA